MSSWTDFVIAIISMKLLELEWKEKRGLDPQMYESWGQIMLTF